MKRIKIISVCFAFIMIACSLTANADTKSGKYQKLQRYEGQYTDVPEDHPYYAAITDAYSYGIVDESAYETFRPDDLMSGGEAAAFAVKLYLLYNGSSPVVVPSDPFVWYSGYYDYAKNSGLATIRDFEEPYPVDWFLDIFSKSISESDLGALDESITAVQTLEEPREPGVVLLFYQAGILDKGEPYDPDKLLTRGEAMQIISRIIDPSLRETKGK